jgi:hypothetical protein
MYTKEMLDAALSVWPPGVMQRQLLTLQAWDDAITQNFTYIQRKRMADSMERARQRGDLEYWLAAQHDEALTMDEAVFVKRLLERTMPFEEDTDEWDRWCSVTRRRQLQEYVDTDHGLANCMNRDHDALQPFVDLELPPEYTIKFVGYENGVIPSHQIACATCCYPPRQNAYDRHGALEAFADHPYRWTRGLFAYAWCECQDCSECGERFVSPCTNCGNHTDCSSDACTCRSCSSCGARGEPGPDFVLCGDADHDPFFNGEVDELEGGDECRRCLDCCRCGFRRSSTYKRPLYDRGSALKFWDSRQALPNGQRLVGPANFAENPLTRFIGVEIEVDGMAGTVPVARVREAQGIFATWRAGCVEDGSLGEHGFEMVSAPANGQFFTDQVKDLLRAAKLCKGKVEDSSGLHVHVDARDLKWWDMRKVVMLYAKVEMAMFSIIAPSRVRSKFCIPCGGLLTEAVRNGTLGQAASKGAKKRVPKEGLLMAVFDTPGDATVPALKAGKYGSDNGDGHFNNQRYHALNLYSWFHRGSIEFRHHHGTLNFDKILNWSMLCANLVETANREGEAVINAWPSGLDGLVQLAPTESCAAWVKARHAHFAAMKQKRVAQATKKAIEVAHSYKLKRMTDVKNNRDAERSVAHFRAAVGRTEKDDAPYWLNDELATE